MDRHHLLLLPYRDVPPGMLPVSQSAALLAKLLPGELEFSPSSQRRPARRRRIRHRHPDRIDRALRDADLTGINSAGYYQVFDGFGIQGTPHSRRAGRTQ